MKKPALILLVLLLWTATATAVPTPTATPTPGTGCTFSRLVTDVSTPIFAANDLPGMQARHYLLVQNIDGTNECWCCMNTNNNCTPLLGFHLRVDAQWLMYSGSGSANASAYVPPGDVSCITGSGKTATVIGCDW